MDKFVTKKPRLQSEEDLEQSTSSKEPKDIKQKNKSTKSAPPSHSTPSISEVTDATTIKEAEPKCNRTFIQSWRVGRPWLSYDGNKMWCKFCSTYEPKIRNVAKSRNMIEGVTVFRKDTLQNHEKTSAHKYATEIDKNIKTAPEKAPALDISLKLDKNNQIKLENLFRNVHALVKTNKSLADYVWLCQLDEVKGLDIGKSYRSQSSAMRFVHAIASYERRKLAASLTEIPFISLTCDGSTDSASIEQEIVFIHYCQNGVINNKFIGIGTPERADADGIFQCLLGILNSLDSNFDRNFLARKLIALGCDGAGVMIGRKGGVSEKLKSVQPSLLTVHCYAHR